MTRFLIALFALAFGTAPVALAAGGGGGGGGTRDGNRIQAGFTLDDPEEGEDPADSHGTDDNPRVIILPAIVSPLIEDDRLRGYAYLQVRMMVREGVDATMRSTR